MRLSIFLFLCAVLFVCPSCTTTDTVRFDLYFLNASIRERTLGFIEGATVSLDLCVYDISDPEVLRALAGKAAQGVAVRVVTEADNLAELGLLTRELEVVVDDDRGLMHCKYMIADGKQVWGGSTNLTKTSLDNHYNDIFIASDPFIVRRFQDHFEHCMNGLFKSDRPSAKEKGPVYFSPEDLPFNALMNLLSSAKEEVLIGIYAFSDYRIAHFLKVLSAHGVEIYVFADRGWNQGSPYSQSVEVDQYTLLRYDLLETGLMHQKFIVVDRSAVLFGTYNFTASAETKNDEYLILSREASVVERFRQRFFELWKASE
ncbi:MAG TPA: phospholipase D-like domain-containing protein [Thermotogota bacterium]|jgi:phosphatidylserine/phosphatidylglycerophosphate/cardiolipin synthase-like enzyme|nr:MAG: Phospholipase D precursor [Thermotogota bacterium ADurb.Bin062]HNW47282.1 phospholipase D-like domain-containing protein [Thermotogota bacterium]HNY81898.1 phospholipase D-like domain-containing protein [Thermotogota bacterium]HOD90922.1 phospholipase D-like domain-containing protein [Thermotogota bacterium]HOH11724.1 phospholipase D-like domain-containing protein [Thermotogota bacterium]